MSGLCIRTVWEAYFTHRRKVPSGGGGSTGGDEPLNGSLPATGRLVSYPPYDRYLTKAPAIKHPLANFKASADDKNEVESNKARVIAAQYFDWAENDDIPKMKTLLDNSCFDVNYTTYNASGAGSVEDFKNLDDYGIVLISSHGDSFYNGLLSLWEDKFKWNGPFGVVIIHSNMAVTTANKITYEDDLKKWRLVLWGRAYGITPTFITKYSKDFPNSLIYMSICRGAWNSSMADAFISSGAGAYFGYSDYVAVPFCIQHGPPLLQGLFEPNKTIADVFVAGQKETDSDPAEFKFYGANDLSIAVIGLQDGSFESGNISQAWTVAGDGRTITGLGYSSPTDVSHMGIISTGLGFTTNSGSISQVICLPGNVSQLVFDWNFFSEEFKEYCNSSYDDRFKVSITDLDTNSKTVVFETSVNTLCANQGALVESPVDFDQGPSGQPGDASYDPGVWYTGWNVNQTVDISAYRGKSVKLEFFATDIGDSIYDTAILIDNIKIVGE
ncbi:MAG: choice-of-anchor L domain-containing protein [Pseudomonadota bacterium]